MITKHISIEEEYIDKIRPYIEKHDGDLGAAIEDIMGQIYNSGSLLIDSHLFDWMIKEDKEMNNLSEFFGEELLKIIKDPYFSSIINKLIIQHISSNYNMVTIHRRYFEDLLADNIPIDPMIEIISRKPLQDIPLDQLLAKIKETYEASRIVDRIEIDKNNLILYHSYRDKKAIDRLKKILVKFLDSSGHLYNVESTSNSIILVHKPDIDTKINDMIDNLKNSNDRIDQELTTFLTILNGARDIPDISPFISIGRNVGKSIMQIYEEENNIKSWSLVDFKNILDIIDSKLGRTSESNIEPNAYPNMDISGNVKGRIIRYIVKKCSVAKEEDKFNPYICHTMREVFKGMLEYTFGNNTDLEIKKLLSHRDSLCEVIIRLK